MKRWILILAAPVVSVALVSGCKQDKGMTDSAGNMMPSNGTRMAVAHIRPAPGASTQPSWGRVSGDVSFKQTGDKVVVTARLSGLPPGTHGIHIHEKGDLSAPDLSSAGPHYDPDMHKMHGAPGGSMVHAGDLGNITADAEGNGKMEVTVNDLSIHGAKNDIIGRSVVVHAKEDDLKTQPSGNSGARIAGGLIEYGK